MTKFSKSPRNSRRTEILVSQITHQRESDRIGEKERQKGTDRPDGIIVKQLQTLSLQTNGVVADKEETLTQWLWNESLHIADEALNTEFIQQMKDGILDPNDFGAYNVQDAVYCFNATQTLQIVMSKSKGVIHEFVSRKMEEYISYTQSLFKDWHIEQPWAITMGEAAKTYADYELEVSIKMDPIYSLIAMIPCAKLWPWIGEQLRPSEVRLNFLLQWSRTIDRRTSLTNYDIRKPGLNKAKKTFGVYKKWIDENLSGDGYKPLEAFVNTYFKTNGKKLNRRRALQVYQRCLQGEAAFFKSATE